MGKLMSMMLWTNPHNESESLGTDLYNNDFEVVKTIDFFLSKHTLK